MPVIDPDRADRCQIELRAGTAVRVELRLR
jgi:hypothetical protein